MYEPTHKMFLKILLDTKAMAPFNEPEGTENQVNIKKSCLNSLGGCADIPNLVDKAEDSDLNAVRTVDGQGKEALIHSEPMLPQMGIKYDFGPTRALRQRKNKPVYTVNSADSDASSTVALTDSDKSYIPARSRSQAASKSKAASKARVTSNPRGTSKVAATSKSWAASRSQRNMNKAHTTSKMDLAPKLAGSPIAQSDVTAPGKFFRKKLHELGSSDRFLWGTMQKMDLNNGCTLPSENLAIGECKDVAMSVVISKTSKLPVARPQIMSKQRFSAEQDQRLKEDDAVKGITAASKTVSPGDTNLASNSINNTERPVHKTARSKTVSRIKTSTFSSTLGSIAHSSVSARAESRQARGRLVSRGINNSNIQALAAQVTAKRGA